MYYMKPMSMAVLFCTTLFFTTAICLAFPNETELNGIQKLCGAGNVDSAEFKTRFDAKIKDWRNASASASIEVAKKNLTGALSQIKEDKYYAASYRIFVDCVDRTLQKYLDHEKYKPGKISTAGQSSVLLRSSFVTDTDILKAGCEEAKSAALSDLTSACPTGVVAVISSRCPQVRGSPRTYTATVEATCTPKN